MPVRTIPFRLSLACAALATAFSAHAQQAPIAKRAAPAATSAQPGDQPKMQTVEVKGTASTYDPRRDDTASKIVVNHDEIVKHGDTSVLDVLKRLPGVTVSGGAGRGGEVRMRGLGSGYTQILINGERAPAGFSMDSLAPDVIERIEVMRAASAEFSTQAVAGTINIVLKRAIKNAQRELKAGIASGNGFVGPNANLQLSDSAGKLSYSLSANVFHQRFERSTSAVEQGFDLAGAQTLQRDSALAEDGRFTAINISPRLNWALDGGDTLTWQTFVNVNRFANDNNTRVDTPLGMAPQFPALDASMSNKNQMLRTDLNWVHKLASGSKLDMKIGGLLGRLGNIQHRDGFSSAGAQTLRSDTESTGTERGISSTGKYTNPLFEGHALALGWDGGYNTRDDNRYEFDALRGVPVSDEVFDGRVARMAVYAQDEWNITPRWSVYLGARWEGIDTRSAGNTFDTATSRTSVWSPLMQTLWKLPGTKGDQLRFAVTRTYKAPSLQNLIPRLQKSENNSSTEPDYRGNPDLKPELAFGLDASYEHYWGEGALVSISASMRRIDGYTRNLLVFDNGRWVITPSNAGQANTRGLELEAKFPLKSVMDNAPAIDLRASVSRNWSSVDSVPGPNNRLDAQTPFSATLGADYKAGALTTGGSFAFRTGGPVRISGAQSRYQSVRRDLDVYALWKFNPKHQLRVAVANILGQDWIDQSSYTDGVGTVARRAIYPGTVTVRATIEMKF